MSKYEYEYLPEAFHSECVNDTIEDWVTPLDRNRGFYTRTTGRPVPIDPLSMKDVISALDDWEAIIKRTKAGDAARRASIASGDYEKRFDHISKDIDPAVYTYAMREHRVWCGKCPV